jgi:integrase
MPTLTERFARDHFITNSISADRQKMVLITLARFERTLPGALEEANDDHLRDWLVTLLEEGLAPSSVRLYMSMVMPFYQWAWERRVISAEHLMRLRTVRPPRGSTSQAPRPYSRKELARMWADLDARWPLLHEKSRIPKRYERGTSPFRSVRKHAMRLQLDAMIELALVCGLRRIEIYRLSLADLHFDNKYIVVHGKRENQNDKVREVPYPDSTREAVWAWFRMRGTMSPAAGVSTWLSVTGPEPAVGLSTHRMAMLLHSFGPWTWHRMRHTAATERLRAGMTLEQLQKFLGHSNIGQTLGYADLVKDDIHKAAERSDAEFQRAIKPHRRAA